MKLRLHTSLIFIVFLYCASCRKSDRDTDITTNMVSDNALAAFCFNDLFIQAHRLALSDSMLNVIGSNIVLNNDCIDTIIHTNSSDLFPDTITVNYGPNNGLACNDGNLRKGKLKIIFSGKYGVSSKNITVIPENYYLNDNKIEGKIEISCRGRNSTNILYFSEIISNGVILNDSIRLQYYAPGKTGIFQREWVSGESTTSVNDDSFQITGSYGGTTSKGATYKTEITFALRNQIDCKWITIGKEKISPLNLSPREVDYGSGCDNKCGVKINGKEFEAALLP